MKEFKETKPKDFTWVVALRGNKSQPKEPGINPCITKIQAGHCTVNHRGDLIFSARGAGNIIAAFISGSWLWIKREEQMT